MKSSDLLRLVDQMHHDKNIKRDVIFDGIEAALQLAAQKHFGEDEGVLVTIDRDSGEISVVKNGEDIDPALLGRIPAQSAKNVMIQKIREAESNSVFNEFTGLRGDLVTGIVQRYESGAAVVSVGRTEAILPKSEQIPGETYHVSDRVKAIISEVKKAGQKVKIILSRTHPDFVRRLFEEEIPEIEERIIEIKAVAREAGYRTKIAVSSIDLKVDCVGACVGVRGSRIKNIVDELGGERIDIVRWNDSLQVMIPNALQPAQIEEVFLYPRPGRTIVLVQEDQLSLAIGRRGQNVRLASKLVGWDIEIMTHEELNDSIEKAEQWFLAIPGVTDELVERFIEEGFMSYDDLSLCDGDELVEISGIDHDFAESIVSFAEVAAEKMEKGVDVSLEAGAKSQVSESVAVEEAEPTEESAAVDAEASEPSIDSEDHHDSNVAEELAEPAETETEFDASAGEEESNVGFMPEDELEDGSPVEEATIENSDLADEKNYSELETSTVDSSEQIEEDSRSEYP